MSDSFNLGIEKWKYTLVATNQSQSLHQSSLRGRKYTKECEWLTLTYLLFYQRIIKFSRKKRKKEKQF